MAQVLKSGMPKMPSKGVMMSVTSDAMTAPNAPAMTTATASAATFPWNRKSRSSLIMILLLLSDSGAPRRPALRATLANGGWHVTLAPAARGQTSGYPVARWPCPNRRSWLTPAWRSDRPASRHERDDRPRAGAGRGPGADAAA